MLPILWRRAIASRAVPVWPVQGSDHRNCFVKHAVAQASYSGNLHAAALGVLGRLACRRDMVRRVATPYAHPAGIGAHCPSRSHLRRPDRIEPKRKATRSQEITGKLRRLLGLRRRRVEFLVVVSVQAVIFYRVEPAPTSAQ